MPPKGVECIYCFYNPATGKSYIGMTTNEPQRHFAHYRKFLQGARTSKLYNSMRKHGWDAFEYRILAVKPEGASDQWLVNAERLAIVMYGSHRNGYNMTPGGEESPMKDPEVAKKSGLANRGRRMPDDLREKLRKRNTGRRATPEQRQRMSLARKGKKQSPEHAAKRGLAIRGPKNGMYGKDFSEEHRQKISAGLKGAANGMHGRTHSEEARRKMSARRRGRKLSPEHCAALSAAQKARYAALRAQKNTQPSSG
jgi:group I intron endonuclease